MPDPALADDAPRAGIGSRATRAVPSTLSTKLAGDHLEAERAFQLARREFIDGRRIEMGALATELGVDRTSLFRWVGNRDELLAEVLWSLAEPTLDHAEAEARGEGATFVADILGRFVDGLVTASYFREFLAREPQRALRLMTTADSEIQRRYVAAVELLLTEHAPDAGGALARHDLAYLLVRISETFSYADLIAGEPPSAERARAAFALVLGA
jgi:hypothetical protein